MFDNALLIPGIPRIPEYNALLESSFFRTMESFSDEFLQKYSFVRDHYKWVKDPFHQWSRQWEYPYVYQSIKSTTPKKSDTRILDAGSGITFFPYFLTGEMEGVSVTCCDSDGKLQSLFERVAQPAVRFVAADLHSLPFANDEFDIVYCVSVLEHTRSYIQILDEFKRILRPNGRLILTCDIGLDGVSDIAPQDAELLLNDIESRFRHHGERHEMDFKCPENLTVRYASSLDRNLVPWKFPHLSLLKAILRSRRLPTAFGKNLTVYCGTFIKPAT